ncbi:MAG TPA: choice-of-anchor Q domain-containing protein [Solirubrobacter sp.]|nr:choice-of-anchor Q domain-containing protein [Solirubrobacter sp.]
MRLAAVTVAALLGLAAPASADVYTVTSTDDVTGQCAGTVCQSIRQALAAAESRPGPDAIQVPAGDFQLSQGPLLVDSEVTITGAGARATTVYGTAFDRVFEIHSPADATISHLTMRGGHATPSGNYFGGNLSNYGGTITLSYVRVTDGHAYSAGGVSNRSGTMTIEHSLIDHNAADGGSGNDIGGVQNFGGDGAPAFLTVRDSTIAFNSSQLGGGLGTSANAGNTTRLERATIVGNTGGSRTDVPNAGGLLIDPGQSISIVGSIIAGNTTSAGPSNCSAQPITSGGYNVQDGTDCQLAGPGDRAQTDPGVGASLTDAGGETDVLALLSGSPAIDLYPGCSGSDQRGVARPQGVACDAGAYELEQAAVAPPPTPTPTPTATPTPEPVRNRSVRAVEVKGTVLVKLPGSKRFVGLDAAVIGNGAEVDARKGTVEITTAGGEKAHFSLGIFKVSQTGGVTTATLTEKLSCPRRSAAHAAAKKVKTRKLFGDGKGKFRTRGQYGAATVRGTKWLVQDTCTTTFFRVDLGVVKVRDDVKKKTLTLRKGGKYTARAKKK